MESTNGDGHGQVRRQLGSWSVPCARHRSPCRRTHARAAHHARPDAAADGGADRRHLSAGPQVREGHQSRSAAGRLYSIAQALGVDVGYFFEGCAARRHSARPRSSGCCWSWRATSSAFRRASTRRRFAPWRALSRIPISRSSAPSSPGTIPADRSRRRATLTFAGGCGCSRGGAGRSRALTNATRSSVRAAARQQAPRDGRRGPPRWPCDHTGHAARPRRPRHRVGPIRLWRCMRGVACRRRGIRGVASGDSSSQRGRGASSTVCRGRRREPPRGGARYGRGHLSGCSAVAIVRSMSPRRHTADLQLEQHDFRQRARSSCDWPGCASPATTGRRSRATTCASSITSAWTTCAPTIAPGTSSRA